MFQNQARFLRRLSKAPIVHRGFTRDSGAVSLSGQEMRQRRTIARFADGSRVELAYDHTTLDVQAIVASGAGTVSATIASKADPETVFTLDPGTGDREEPLPSVEADKIKAQKLSQYGARWGGTAVQVAGG